MKKLTLIVVRTNKDLSLSNSMPCFNCVNILKDIGIEKIIYSSGDKNIYKKVKIHDLPKHVSKGGLWMKRLKIK